MEGGAEYLVELTDNHATSAVALIFSAAALAGSDTVSVNPLSTGISSPPDYSIGPLAIEILRGCLALDAEAVRDPRKRRHQPLNMRLGVRGGA